MPSSPARPTAAWLVWLCLGFVALLAWGTYVKGYDRPAALFWDENYHVVSAQKYLNGVFFMELHPPLGKLLIALGERLVHANPRDDQFLTTDYAREIPPGFSLAGYRLLPTALAWLTAPLVFLIFLRLTSRLLAATVLSFLYVFDNALIVHLRGAMLEGPLLFFTAVTVLLFLSLPDWAERPPRLALGAFAFGLGLGLALATKVLALILVLLVPAALWRLRASQRRGLTFVGLALTGCLVAYVTVWQIHFALARRIVPELPNHGYYQASDAYKRILAERRNASLGAFPVMLRDSWRWVSFYNRGVPTLDLCKPGENGSPFYLWPLGARAINYRWETLDGVFYRYLYLQANPIGWACGLAGVLLAIGLGLRSLLMRPRQPLRNGYPIAVFLGLYLAYMLAVSRVARVLYLYHYFIPLLLSFFLFGLTLMELSRLGRFPVTESRRTILVLVVGGLVLVSHHFYRPLTYYEPITDAEFRERALIPLWDLRCANCGSVSFWCRRPAKAVAAPLRRERGPAGVPVRHLLEGVGHAEERALLPRPAGNLEANR